MILCLAGSYFSSLTPRTMVMSSPLAGARDDHLLGAALQVGRRLVGVGEDAGGLDHDVHAQVAPGDLGGVLLGEDPHLLAVHHQGVLLSLHGAREAAVGGVVLEQVGVGLGVGQVVDRHDLQLVRVALHDGAQGLAPDASEAVDPDPSSHCHSPSSTGWCLMSREVGPMAARPSRQRRTFRARDIAVSRALVQIMVSRKFQSPRGRDHQATRASSATRGSGSFSH